MKINTQPKPNVVKLPVLRVLPKYLVDAHVNVNTVTLHLNGEDNTGDRVVTSVNNFRGNFTANLTLLNDPLIHIRRSSRRGTVTASGQLFNVFYRHTGYLSHGPNNNGVLPLLYTLVGPTANTTRSRNRRKGDIHST